MELKLALLESEKQRIKDFLLGFELNYDLDLDFSLYIEEDKSKEIIGTISTSKNIIKAFAVHTNYKGQIASLLISEAINYLYNKGYYYYRVYTSPKNITTFKALNFYEIISSDKVALLESKNRNIEIELKNKVKKYNLASNDTGCIVMNCNPFTLGHRYLIESAAKAHKLLIVFILEEEASFFDFVDRYKMVTLGTRDLDNVRIVPSTDYLISSLTFPTYFLKKEDSKIFEQAQIDAKIFEKYFIPIFNLKKRYLGSEEDLVTGKYNQVLKNTLGEFIEIIERIKYKDDYISASIVRKLINNNDFSLIKNYVPQSTFDYLRNVWKKF